MEVQRQIWRENFGRGGESRRSTVQGPPLRTLDNFLEHGCLSLPEKEVRIWLLRPPDLR
jgi:hypothetical protein